MLKVNQYFDGKVASIALQTATLPATVGVMQPGEYTFGTSQFETMSIISGALTVKLPGEAAWQTFAGVKALPWPRIRNFICRWRWTRLISAPTPN